MNNTQTLVNAYEALSRRVQDTLRIQHGDVTRLRAQIDEVKAFAVDAERARNILIDEDFNTLQGSVQTMLRALEESASASQDDLTGDPIPLALTTGCGQPGRPRIQIDKQWLAYANQGMTTKDIAKAVGCAPRTVRRYLILYGLSEPAPPVIQHVERPDGTYAKEWHPTGPTRSAIRNDPERLDGMVKKILDRFPNYSLNFVRAALRTEGHRVSRDHIRTSLIRVRGLQPRFINRPIERRIYSVPEVNSLWHHDGNHKLIRWKFVIHGFIDGKSRFITGIKCSTNNRAATVLNLFLEAVKKHGLPSRVRGDHGTENLRVAAHMIQERGDGRGSYIWGRSVHNIRIERLWVEVKRNIVTKWKPFFERLEAHHGLRVDSAAHLWLLHHLFLETLNNDIQQWAEHWNAHGMRLKREKDKVPRDMFIIGMRRRGVDDTIARQEDAVENVEEFGIDWEGLPDVGGLVPDDEELVRQLQERGQNPFDDYAPDTLNEVPCEPPECPLTLDQVNGLESTLSARFNMSTSHDMDVYTDVWIRALAWCRDLF